MYKRVSVLGCLRKHSNTLMPEPAPVSFVTLRILLCVSLCRGITPSV